MNATERQKTPNINICYQETPPILSRSEQECLRELLSNDFVLDDDQDVPDCKKLGQKFFDQFKIEWCDCSSEAVASMQKVCEAIDQMFGFRSDLK